jgi:hypothetical protein
MKVQEQDIYHGIALTQLVEHASFKAINKTSKTYGLYDLNQDRRLFIKYRSNTEEPWSFTFQPAEMEVIGAPSERDTFVALVCGTTTVCALTLNELETLIDLTNAGSQWVRVEAPPGASMRVLGPLGHLPNVVPHNSYPAKLFQ